jgi:hypothetical protein
MSATATPAAMSRITSTTNHQLRIHANRLPTPATLDAAPWIPVAHSLAGDRSRYANQAAPVLMVTFGAGASERRCPVAVTIYRHLISGARRRLGDPGHRAVAVPIGFARRSPGYAIEGARASTRGRPSPLDRWQRFGSPGFVRGREPRHAGCSRATTGSGTRSPERGRSGPCC